MKTDDEYLAICAASVCAVDPSATVAPAYRADDPKLIASIRVTLGPGATHDTRMAVRSVLNATAQARWGITYGGENLPS